jgi:hypothetical protein
MAFSINRPANGHAIDGDQSGVTRAMCRGRQSAFAFSARLAAKGPITAKNRLRAARIRKGGQKGCGSVVAA